MLLVIRLKLLCSNTLSIIVNPYKDNDKLHVSQTLSRGVTSSLFVVSKISWALLQM